MTSIHRLDATVGQAEKTPTGRRVPIFTGDPETAIEIVHNLGRVPVDIWITDRDRDCGFYTVHKDAYRHVAVFTEAGVNLHLRYE
jgi:hypothetical protein